MEPYTCTLQTLKATLDEYGVAIIENVLDDTECAGLLKGMWSSLEQISSAWETPIRQDDPATWRGLFNLLPMHSMLLQHWQIGHAQAIWDVRQNAKCIEVFETLWQCAAKDLLVSFDGCSFAMPPEVTKRGWYRGNTWFHTDQSYTTPEFRCVQGWVTALDVNEGDATLAFLEKSHLHHADFANTFGITDKADWYKLNGKEQEAFYLETKKCALKKIVCPKGSMVLWDSRTIHCG
jgi:ectoine hydroxylase-related dioxygenase (phytanoyl-CoA dioxygenase family)